MRSFYVPFWLPWQFEAHEIKITGPFGRQGRIEFNAIENYGWFFPGFKDSVAERLYHSNFSAQNSVNVLT